MKGHRQTLLTLVAVVSLVTIGIVLFTGILQQQPKEFFQKKNMKNVLGEQLINDTQNFVQKTLENTLSQTTETVSQKTVEVEQQILSQVQKEIATLSENQITALKTQICRDLGVLPSGNPTPSFSPTPTR